LARVEAVAGTRDGSAGDPTPRSRAGITAWVGRHALALVLAVAALHGLFYVVAIPAWDLFDEEQHLAYALTVRDERRIPHLNEPLRQDIVDAAAASDRWAAFRLGRPSTFDPASLGLEGRSYEAYQPPLYYVLLVPSAALAGDDATRALYVARLHGPFLLAALVGASWFLALRWFPDIGQFGATCAALTVAAIPAAAQAASRVNNDLAAAVLIALGLLLLTKVDVHARPREAALLGGVAAAAALTKSHGLLLVPLVVVGLALLLRERRLSPRVALLSLAPAAAAVLAWALWNHQRYGTPDGATAYLRLYRTYQPLPMRKFPEAIWLTAWSDYWGAYQTGATLRLLTNLTIIAILLVAGWALFKHQPSLTSVALAGTLAVALVVALLYANHTAIVRPGGRVMLPIYPALVVLTVAGWGRLWSRTGMLVPVVATWLLSVAYAVSWFLPFFHE
jgi:hypothetical protein